MIIRWYEDERVGGIHVLLLLQARALGRDRFRLDGGHAIAVGPRVINRKTRGLAKSRMHNASEPNPHNKYLPYGCQQTFTGESLFCR